MAQSLPAAPTTSIPLLIAFSISVFTTSFAKLALAYKDRLMISAFWLIAYSIPAIIDETVPCPSSPSALIEMIFAFSFCDTMALTISSPCEFEPTITSSIKDTLSIIFADSLAPVSISAITLSESVVLTGVVSPAASFMAEIGFADSDTSKSTIFVFTSVSDVDISASAISGVSSIVSVLLSVLSALPPTSSTVSAVLPSSSLAVTFPSVFSSTASAVSTVSAASTATSGSTALA